MDLNEKTEALDLLQDLTQKMCRYPFQTNLMVQCILFSANFPLKSYGLKTLTRLLSKFEEALLSFNHAIELGEGNCLCFNDVEEKIAIANSLILNPEGKKINQKIDGRGRAREDKQSNSLIVYLFMNFQRPLKELYGIQKEEIDIYNKLLLIDAEHVSAMLLSSFRLEQIHLLLEITFNVDDEALKEDEAEDISF